MWRREQGRERRWVSGAEVRFSVTVPACQTATLLHVPFPDHPHVSSRTLRHARRS